MIKEFIVKDAITVKEYLAKNISSALLKRLSQDSLILVNDQLVYNYYLMKKGDVLKIVIPCVKTNVKATKADIDILYEDDYLIILNKPNNLATIPTREHYNNSLANYLAYYYITKGIAAGIHFYSRLDFATSGIILAAKDIYTLDLLNKAKITKKYLALIKGSIPNQTVTTKIIKDPNSIIKRMNVEGNNATTIFKTIKQMEDTSLIEATLKSGKTHQIRLHVKYLNSYVIGDELYGESADFLHLHSFYLSFIHPITKKEIEIINYPKWAE